MRAVATVRPRSHSLTFYYVKLCSWACVNVQTVVAISLSDCSAFACGFLQLGFGYCWLTTAAHSALHIFSASLPLFSPPEPLEKKKGKKNHQKKSFTEVCRLFSSMAFESVNEPPVWLPPMFSQNSFGAAQHFASLR